ncbi:hypothetical protein JW964_14080 [candidate division KSB1 bacterium]|nr:hypothetical protein [candidate division KSB1 bacterium]
MRINANKILMGIFYLFLSYHSTIFAQFQDEIRIRETNKHYEQGDWSSYTCGRFVNSIAIGNEFIYFATTGGILRYQVFENKWLYPWTVSNGLAHNRIIAVAFNESTNTLWCSTPVGVSYYENSSRMWHNLFYDEIGIRSNDFIHSIGFVNDQIILETHDGRILLSSNEYGNLNFNNGNWQNIPNSNSVAWYGHRGKSNAELPLLFMSDGYLFDSRGIITDTNMRHFDITYYIFDKWGYIWIGTWGLGAARADTRTQQMELLTFGLMNGNVSALALSNEEFWIGGWDPNYYKGTDWGLENGLTRWDTRYQTWDYFQAKFITGFNNDQALSIAIDTTQIWIGTEQALVEYNVDRNRWYSFDPRNGLRNNLINDIVFNDDYLWVASPSGIDQIEKATLHTDSVAIERVGYDRLREIEVFDLELVDSTLWAATKIGLYFYDLSNQTGRFLEGDWSPRTTPVTALGKNSTSIWCGGPDGVYAYNFIKKTWFSSPERNDKFDQRINYIQATDNVVFVATDNGVWKYDLDRRYWRQFTMEDGLLSPIVNVIRIEGEYVWFGTAEGLCRFYWNSPMRID